jgi:exosortase/archaeosortase family protein
VPIAVVANIIRITGIAMAAKCFGREVAVGLYHNWSGYIVFVAAVILMVATGTLIDRAADKLRSLKRTGLS